MLTILLLIIAISFDAMSFGLAQGLKKVKISFINVFIMTIISTIIFTIPLYLSKFVAKYLSENICNIINGAVLIFLGIYYLKKYFNELKIKDENNNKNLSKTNLSLKQSILATFPISLDAIFTAFLNGYTLSYIIFGIIFYFFITFLSIYVLNLIGLKLSKSTKLNLGFLSSIIFITIGILKIFGI